LAIALVLRSTIVPQIVAAADSTSDDTDSTGNGNGNSMGNNDKDTIIGIDLGTTYSCVAVVEKDGKVKVIADADGNHTTPSWVAFTESGTLVGQAAKNQVDKNPENTIYDTKRLIGQSYKRVKSQIKEYSFNVVEHRKKPRILAMNRGKEFKFAPEEISAMVLSHMKNIAEDYLGEPVERAVITVPAYFNDGQRAATKAAGRIAGLKVDRIINEPTAASMAYGIDKLSNHRTIMVYDLGGGTFDVTALVVDGGVFEVQATNGDTHLGGEDIDEALMKHFLKMFKKKTGKKIPIDANNARQRLRQAVNEAKHVVSTKMSASINIPDLFEGEDMNEVLTRARFEDVAAPVLKKTMIPIANVLEDAELTPEDIDDVVLVGGSTRIPYVRKLLRDFFGKSKINTDVNPDEAVAIGAAIQGSVMAGQRVKQGGTGKNKNSYAGELVLLDVTPLSLGIAIQGGVFSQIIPRNSLIPSKLAKTYTTVRANQPSILVEVYQGESEMAKRNEKLGTFELDNIPPAPRGQPQIEVEFYIDANGMLEVTATNLGTQHRRRIQIKQGKGRFTDEQIEKLQARAEKFAKQDQEEMAAAKLLADFISLMERVDTHVNQLTSKLNSWDASTIANAVYDAKLWADHSSKGASVAKIMEEQRKVFDIWRPIVREATGRIPSYFPDNTDGDSDSETFSSGMGGEFMNEDDDDDHMEL
jgi:heat shock protein 5